MRIIGGRLFDVCGQCGDVVRIDKPIFGSLHICLSEDDNDECFDQVIAKVKRTKRQLERAD